MGLPGCCVKFLFALSSLSLLICFFKIYISKKHLKPVIERAKKMLPR
jgi:hypothetical protein